MNSFKPFNAEDAEHAERANILGINDLSHSVIGAAIEVHRELGPGLLESAYEAALSRELQIRAIPHLRQKTMPLTYKECAIESGYRIDLLVDNRLVIELKAIEQLLPIHSVQVLTYMRLGSFPLGLLINFNVRRLVDGIERVSNNATDLALHSLSSLRPPRPPR